MTIQFLLISFIASALGGVSGIGGGVIIKPALDSFTSLNVSTISFLSGCTVLSMTIVTLYRNRKLEIKLHKRISSLLAFGGILGGLAGKYLFDVIMETASSEASVGALQSAVLGIMVFGVLLFLIFKRHLRTFHLEHALPIVLVGLLLGSVASFLGIGGGPINIALLYLLFSMNSKEAALNSIFIIFLSQSASLIFTAARSLIPSFDPLILAMMITGGISGALLGSFVTRKVSLRGVDTIFAAVLVIILGMSAANFISLV
jgi:uncharacterized membrane protein YfcA